MLLRRLLVAVAAFAVAFTLVPQTAGAVETGDSGRVTQPDGSSNPGGSGTGACRDGNGYSGSSLTWTLYARCFDPGTYATWGYWYCNVGWEVWRWWGTERAGVRGWSVSRVQFADRELYECPSATKTAFVRSHPDDDGTPRSPFQAVLPYNGPAQSNQFGYGRTGDDPMVNPSVFYKLGVDLPGVRSRPYAAGIPVKYSWVAGAGNADQSCDVFSRRYPDPIAQILAGARSDDPAKQAAAASVQAFLVAKYREYAGRFGDAYARAYTNLASVNPFRYDDGVACSSGLDMLVPAEVDGRRVTDPNHYGFCAIPLYRTAQTYTRGVSYPARNPIRYERYTNIFERKPAWARGETTLTAQMRDIIYNQVLRNRTTHPYATSLFDQRGSRNAWYQRSSAGEAVRTYAGSRAEIAATASQAALCTDYNAGVYEAATRVEEPPPADGVVLTVTADPVGQVGGKVRPYRVTVTAPTELTCQGRPCSQVYPRNPPRLVSINWDLVLGGTGGYRPCTTATSLGCDYYVASRSNTAAEVWFFNATAAAERFSIEIRNATATYLTFSTITTCIPIPDLILDGSSNGGNSSRCVPVEEVVATTHTITPTVVGAPRQVDVVSATPR